jgi:acetyl-CoA carboxylase carboxyltransferase component
VYDVRRVIDLIADQGSVLELRRDFGTNMITALVRIEGRPLGLLANNPMVLGRAGDMTRKGPGAPEFEAADVLPTLTRKAVEHIGRQAASALAHAHAAGLASWAPTSPFRPSCCARPTDWARVVGGSFHLPTVLGSSLAQSGEFGPMNLEGAVARLPQGTGSHHRPCATQGQICRDGCGGLRARQGAERRVTMFEIDDVIDPADTRSWIMGVAFAAIDRAPNGEKRACVDTW